MFSQCTVVCCSCGGLMDYMKRYGRESCCCSKECWDNFEWRHTLAILGKPYYPKTEKPNEDREVDSRRPG